MGIYETAYWQADGWGANRREQQSGTYHPYLPDTIAHRELLLYPETAAAVSRAESAVLDLQQTAQHLSGVEPLARLMLRSEAIASSRIEGFEVSAGKLLEREALQELGVPMNPNATEAEVLSNIDAMQQSIEMGATTAAITPDTFCTIHATLLEKTRMADYGGQVRTLQNWIGGNNANPIGAAYVPPAPEHLKSLLDDLAEFCNQTALPPVAQAAMVHAQFETIHPFADGNGRTGRALIHLILKRRGIAPKVVPPISLVLATDRERYIDNLAHYRYDDRKGETYIETANAWIEYVAHMTEEVCVRALGFENAIDDIRTAWMERFTPRKGSTLELLINKLPEMPVVSIPSAARLTGRSHEAARLAVARLHEAGVLRQNARNRKSNIYVAQEIIDAFTSYERALAVPSGNTAMEKPQRAVPQRPSRTG